MDLLLRGGSLIDGSGSPARMADVAIRDGRIVALGDDARGLPAEREIDIGGLTVAPGFVDIHSHADLILLADDETRERLLGAKIAQGVTTVVIGNCGLGPAPANDEAAAILSGVNAWMTPDGVDAGALTTGEYLDRLDARGVPLNVATLVPHGPLRISATGLTPGAPDDAALHSMGRELDQALQDGAFGLSTGLIYPPGMYSPPEELTYLALRVAARSGLYTSHIRGSSETLLQATAELIDIAEQSGARVHHSHLEAVGRDHWGEIAEVLALEDAARERGLRVSHDMFPYTRAATMMVAIFPPWALDGGVPALLERLRDPIERRRIKESIENDRPQWPPWQPGGWPHNLVGAVGWDGILIASVGPGGPARWVGRSLADLGAELGREPFDVVADLMLEQEGRVGQLVAEISGAPGELDVLLSILQHPAAALISDAEDYGRGVPHPAHAGAFARALRLNRERGLMPLPELVRRMSEYPAGIIGLEDRGRVRIGAPADLVVFDPAKVVDRADWTDPRARAAGIPWVTINGEPVVENGRYVGGSAGTVLRKGRSASR
ncbi:hypothetical protein ABI59_10980 [Acidobacteria bacterium Mor1]|nr:hypothetical protein ABI59_10980 [Acidobacteria bacterium Mor1]